MLNEEIESRQIKINLGWLLRLATYSWVNPVVKCYEPRCSPSYVQIVGLISNTVSVRANWLRTSHSRE